MFYPCPNCKTSPTPHTTLRERGNMALVRCQRCGTTHKVYHKEEKKREVLIPTLIHKHEVTEKKTLRYPANLVLNVGKTYSVEGENLRITKIENLEKKFVERSEAGNISRVYAVSLDLPARIKVNISEMGKTASYRAEVPRDQELGVGQVWGLKDVNFEIKAIRTTSGVIKKGFVKADEIRVVQGVVTKKRPVGVLFWRR